MVWGTQESNEAQIESNRKMLMRMRGGKKEKWTMTTDTNRNGRAFPGRDERARRGKEQRRRERKGKKQENGSEEGADHWLGVER